MNRDDIMKVVSPEGLFTKGNITQEYHDLAKRWHPDMNRGDNTSEVFVYIQQLYKEGLRKIEGKTWGFENAITIQDITGRKYIIRFLYKAPFELGLMYIGKSIIAYEVPKKYKKLVDNFRSITSTVKYPDNSKGMEKTLPKIKVILETSDTYVLLLEKTEEVVPLNVAINYFGGKIEPKSMAWIMSNLHNILCFLKYNGISHNAITSETVFISPTHHTALLLGGWWYAAPLGEDLVGMPRVTYSTIPPGMRGRKKSDMKIDRIMVNALGREILGDRIGISNPSVPQPLWDWLTLPPEYDPYNAYCKWSEVLVESFGPRKFIEMIVNPKEAYNKMPRKV